MAKTSGPFIKTKENHNSISLDFAVALVPILVWSVFVFGARVITLSLIGIVFTAVLDYLVQRFVFQRREGVRIDVSASVYALLSVFMMPVSVPLWVPIVSSVLVVLAKNLRVFRAKRLLNPFVFQAAVLNVIFPKIMTAFTKPFAYFSAFDISIDPILLDHYRVISPLQYMADGSVYEDGVMAQLYGFASGNIGEIAVFAIAVAAIWLFFRKVANPYLTFFVIFPVIILSLIFPSADAESAFFAYSTVLSGSLIFLSVFAVNESCTVPQTGTGRILFATLLGVLTFALRKTGIAFDWAYVVVLALNAASPYIDLLIRKYTKLK